MENIMLMEEEELEFIEFSSPETPSTINYREVTSKNRNSSPIKKLHCWNECFEEQYELPVRHKLTSSESCSNEDTDDEERHSQQHNVPVADLLHLCSPKPEKRTRMVKKCALTPARKTLTELEEKYRFFLTPVPTAGAMPVISPTKSKQASSTEQSLVRTIVTRSQSRLLSNGLNNLEGEKCNTSMNGDNTNCKVKQIEKHDNRTEFKVPNLAAAQDKRSASKYLNRNSAECAVTTLNAVDAKLTNAGLREKSVGSAISAPKTQTPSVGNQKRHRTSLAPVLPSKMLPPFASTAEKMQSCLTKNQRRTRNSLAPSLPLTTTIEKQGICTETPKSQRRQSLAATPKTSNGALSTDKPRSIRRSSVMSATAPVKVPATSLTHRRSLLPSSLLKENSAPSLLKSRISTKEASSKRSTVKGRLSNSNNK